MASSVPCLRSSLTLTSAVLRTDEMLNHVDASNSPRILNTKFCWKKKSILEGKLFYAWAKICFTLLEQCWYCIIWAATREIRSSEFPTRSDTNRPVQSKKQARSLKFRIWEEERLYYLCRENKGADQLCSYCDADLRLCFRKGKNLVFSRCGSYDIHVRLMYGFNQVSQSQKTLITLLKL